MYREYLSFSKDGKNREETISRIKNSWGCSPDNISEEKIQNGMFCDFVMENKTRNYNIKECSLLDFPLTFLSKIIEKFVEDPYVYAWGVDEEIAKPIFNLWGGNCYP